MYYIRHIQCRFLVVQVGLVLLDLLEDLSGQDEPSLNLYA